MEVRYSTSYPPVPSNYSGPSIERVFGTTINSLELLLIERNIKGPCWLDVKCPLPTGVQTTWCKIKVQQLYYSKVIINIYYYKCIT